MTTNPFTCQRTLTSLGISSHTLQCWWHLIDLHFAVLSHSLVMYWNICKDRARSWAKKPQKIRGLIHPKTEADPRKSRPENPIWESSPTGVAFLIDISSLITPPNPLPQNRCQPPKSSLRNRSEFCCVSEATGATSGATAILVSWSWTGWAFSTCGDPKLKV